MTYPPHLIAAERQAYARYMRARHTQYEPRAFRLWAMAKDALIAAGGVA